MATQIMRNGWFGKATFSVGLFSATASLSLDANLGAALFGLACGHLFDLWAKGELLTTLFAATRTRGKRRTTGAAFMQLTFTGLGDISRARPDHHAAHLRYVEQLGHRLHLDRRARKDAMQWFLQGRGPNYDFSDLIATCTDGYSRAPLLTNMALECFCSCALLGGIPNKAQRLRLDAFAVALGAPTSRVRILLHELAPIANRTEELAAAHRTTMGLADFDSSAIQAALALFELTPAATAEEIKQAYRRYVARHHPDKLSAESPREKRRQAEHNMQQAQDALALLQK